MSQLLHALRANWGNAGAGFLHLLSLPLPQLWRTQPPVSSLLFLSPGSTPRTEMTITVCLIKLQGISKICPPTMLINSKISPQFASLWSLLSHVPLLGRRDLLPLTVLSVNLQPNLSSSLKKLDFLLDFPVAYPFKKMLFFLFYLFIYLFLNFIFKLQLIFNIIFY